MQIIISLTNKIKKMALPKTPRGIKSLIVRLEKQLQYEKRHYGYYDDGGGVRFLIGPLYVLLQDYEGALKEFKLFDRRFFDDSGEPEHRIMWALALYKNGKLKEAENKLLEVLFLNLYMIPNLLDLPVANLNIDMMSGDSTLEYAQSFHPELKKVWEDDALIWAESIYNSDSATKLREKIIQNWKLIYELPTGLERSNLLDELDKLQFELYPKTRQKKIIKDIAEDDDF